MTPKSPILYDFRANYFSDLRLWDRPELDSVPLVGNALTGAGPDLCTNQDDGDALTLLQRRIFRDVFAERRASAGTQKTLSAMYSSGSSGSASRSFTSATRFSSKASEIYLRKISPRTTCL